MWGQMKLRDKAKLKAISKIGVKYMNTIKKKGVDGGDCTQVLFCGLQAWAESPQQGEICVQIF